jgi:hypothetical protein
MHRSPKLSQTLRPGRMGQYGYCASHSRYFWGLRLHLVCTLHGLPVIGDKNYFGREFEQELAELDIQLLRQSAPEFESFNAARSWTRGLSDTAWIDAGSSAQREGLLMKRIWQLAEV